MFTSVYWYVLRFNTAVISNTGGCATGLLRVPVWFRWSALSLLGSDIVFFVKRFGGMYDTPRHRRRRWKMPEEGTD